MHSMPTNQLHIYPDVPDVFIDLRLKHRGNWFEIGEEFAGHIADLHPEDVTSHDWLDSLYAGLRFLENDNPAVSCAVVQGWMVIHFPALVEIVEIQGDIHEFINGVECAVLNEIALEFVEHLPDPDTDYGGRSS
jgi:hypothetical protein